MVYAALSAHRWPGNVRELESVIRYAALLSEGGEVSVEDLPPPRSGRVDGSGAPVQPHGLDEALLLPIVDARTKFEHWYLTQVLAETGGNVSEAARRVKMSRSAFRELLKRADVR